LLSVRKNIFEEYHKFFLLATTIKHSGHREEFERGLKFSYMDKVAGATTLATMSAFEFQWKTAIEILIQ